MKLMCPDCEIEYIEMIDTSRQCPKCKQWDCVETELKWQKQCLIAKKRIHDLENALLDMWFQFAYNTVKDKTDNNITQVYYTGGLSALEECEYQLKQGGILNEFGDIDKDRGNFIAPKKRS